MSELDKLFNEENQAKANIDQPIVMRSFKEAQERISFNDQEIQSWSAELRKTLAVHHEYRDEGYVDHCRDLIANLKADTEAIKWCFGLL